MKRSLACTHISSSVSHVTARPRGVLCVSGERGPLASERHALHRKDSSDGRSKRTRRREPREAAAPSEGQPRGVPWSSEARPGGRRKGRSNRGDARLRRAVRESAEEGWPRERSREKDGELSLVWPPSPGPSLSSRCRSCPSALASNQAWLRVLRRPIGLLGLARGDPGPPPCSPALVPSRRVLSHAARRLLAGFARHTVRHQGSTRGIPQIDVTPRYDKKPGSHFGSVGGSQLGLGWPLRARNYTLLK